MANGTHVERNGCVQSIQLQDDGRSGLFALVMLFVEELQKQIAGLINGAASTDREHVYRLSDTLNAPSAGLGFQAVTQAARALDETARARAEITSLEAKFEALQYRCMAIETRSTRERACRRAQEPPRPGC